MNDIILTIGVQDFISKNISADTLSILLKKSVFQGVSQKELVEQIEAKKKSRDKLPTWFASSHIYYPSKLNIEQTSSESTAEYKARIVSGKTLVDLTGGFGVDSYFFSKKMASVIHCEINSELSEIAAHNFKVLGRNNIKCLPEDGITFLKESTQNFDWTYVDPSRRSDKKGKVFLLEDCLPDVPEHLPLIFERTQHILLKTSPLLDIKKGIGELEFVKEVHVVATNNEVKELLFVLEKGYNGSIGIKTVNLLPDRTDEFNFKLEEEQNTAIDFGEPSAHLYEPNAAILKSGGFKSVAKTYKLKKLHPHSHLYTADTLVDFPGRRFTIEKTLPYSKKSIRSMAVPKANITTRNFPLSVAELRKRHTIKDGGETYLFFTTDINDNLIFLLCKKI
ncbi:THUMP-like domain-containing protein [Flagellimonas halotolerans]|uniref:Class I SAM-dependent methyltransferase n=1 Tax=Flagellimonas halotolerans TaxID=3112164 RepID=A0ABU6ISQ3_9FLAO|nr:MULTISPECIES: class I SAM-dependent methyltransferase [unclassified Allomuricauda]MEC3966118.1 class I SAM-dependent methyltransferase [Muricauda sp. SYSU M86414]MEC4265983.1 class I SAM-dependent methyltransferase [Muricauda sp. SYSU M84420]